MSKLVWLASYPKSGNTWLRAFLTNYLRNASQPAGINELDVAHTAGSRVSFDELVGVDASELTPDQVRDSRPMVYRLLAELGAATRYIKVHDAYQLTPSGEALFPADATQGVLYLVRHPCDVAVSYAHHNSISLDRAITFMGDSEAALARGVELFDMQLEQKLLSWSGHVCSWLAAPLTRLVLRYEDMLSDPVGSFGAAVQFAGLEYDGERLKRAIQFSRFQELQAQEARGNFAERLPHAPNFFRQGKAGMWREHMTAAQVAAIVAAHGSVMRRFGYLDSGGNVL